MKYHTERKQCLVKSSKVLYDLKSSDFGGSERQYTAIRPSCLEGMTKANKKQMFYSQAM